MLGAACALLALASPCRADDRPRISVVAGTRGAMAHRLSQELEAAGLSVKVEASEQDAAQGALFVVVPAGDGGPIEIWSKSADRPELITSVAPEQGTLDTRVLRAAELVRALAFPAPTKPPSAAPTIVAPARPEPARPAPVPRPITAPPPRWISRPPTTWTPAPPTYVRPPAPKTALLDVGVALALGAQAQGLSMALDASLRIWPHARVGVGLFAELPIVGATIDAPEGSATLRPAFFGAEIVTAPIARTGRVALVLAPGAGLCNVSVSGDARPPYLDSDTSAITATVYGRGELRLRVADAVHLTAGANGFAVLPPVAVHFAERAITTFNAHGSFSLGISIER